MMRGGTTYTEHVTKYLASFGYGIERERYVDI